MSTYGLSLKNKENKQMFSMNTSETLVLTDSFETTAPLHVWNSIQGTGVNAKTIPASLVVINFPSDVFPSFNYGSKDMASGTISLYGCRVEQPKYNSTVTDPPPKPMKINLFTPMSESKKNWESIHSTYKYGITSRDTNNNLMISPALQFLRTKGLITATVAEIKAFMMSREEEIVTHVWNANQSSNNPSGVTLYQSLFLKDTQFEIRRASLNDLNSYNEVTGAAIMNQPMFTINMRRYEGVNKTYKGIQTYYVGTKLFQDRWGYMSIGWWIYVNTGNYKFKMPPEANENPFLAIIVDTESYH